MGLFDSIGSVTSALDIGNMVRGAVDSVLPKNMAFVGDIAGAGVDYYTGNYVGAAKLGLQALKDLPQATNGQQASQTPGANQAGKGPATSNKPGLEPPPPPLARDPQSYRFDELLAAIKALVEAMTGQRAPAASSSGGTASSNAGAPAATASASTSAATSANTLATTNTKTPATTTPATANASSPASTPSTTTSTPAPAPTAKSSAPPPPASSGWRTGPAPRPATAIEEQRDAAGGWKREPQTATAQTAWSDSGRNDGQQTPTYKTRHRGDPSRDVPTTSTPATAPATTAAAPAAPAAASTASPAAASTASPAAAPASAPATTAAAPAADHPAAAAAPSTSTSTTSTKPSSSASSPAAPSADKGHTISSVSQMQGMSNAAFMDAVSNGRISPDVAKDPAAMMAIQQRMNDITQMNNLMTAMMRAIHDMQMAVIQNIRI